MACRIRAAVTCLAWGEPLALALMLVLMMLPALTRAEESIAHSASRYQCEESPAVLSDQQVDSPEYNKRLLQWRLNGVSAGEHFVILGQCEDIYLASQTLTDKGLCSFGERSLKGLTGYVRLNGNKGISGVVNGARQELTINVPTSSFCPTRIDMSLQQPQARIGPQSYGGFANYNVSAGKTESSDASFSGYLGVGAFGDWGVLQSQYSGYGIENDTEIQRIATYWKFDNPNETATVRVGDVFAGSTPWRTGAAMAGFQIRRNYATRPEMVTGPVIDFQALIDTQAQILIAQRGLGQPEVIGNAYFGSGYQVPAGPVEVVNQPLFSNTVQTLTLREADGTVSILEVPSYFTVGQLRQGFDDFEIAAGIQRRGVTDDYDEFASLFSYRRGVNRWITLGLGGAASEQKVNGGVFAQTTLPKVGALQTHVATSKALPGGSQPWAAAATLSNQYRRYSYSFSYEQQDNGFTPSLVNAPLTTAGFYQWVGSVAFQPRQGVSLRFGFNYHDSEVAPARTALTTGFNFYFGNRLRLQFSHTEQIDPERSGLSLASFEMPLSSRPRVRGRLEASQVRGNEAVVDASLRALGKAGYPSVQLRHRVQGGDLTALSASIERSAFGAYASVVEAEDIQSFRAGVAGGVVMAEKTLKPTRFANGGFALVELGPDLSGVRVNGIPTDDDGKVILVGLPAFRETELHVRDSDLPYNTTLGNEAIVAAPKDLSLVKITPDFIIYRDALVPVRAIYPDGVSRPLPVSAFVISKNGDEQTQHPVGFDGTVYVNATTEKVDLIISDGGWELCRVTVNIPAPGGRTPTLPMMNCMVAK